MPGSGKSDISTCLFDIESEQGLKEFIKIHLHVFKEEAEDNYRNFHSEQLSLGSKIVTTELKFRIHSIRIR